MTRPDLVALLAKYADPLGYPMSTYDDIHHLLSIILTLQSSLAEQEKTISKLREEVKEAREDYFRRHNDAANAFEEIAMLQSQLAEARNSGLDLLNAAEHRIGWEHSVECALILFADADHKQCDCGHERLCVAVATIRSLKSQEKK